jgi:RNA polymerase sigma-70 factor (ECF subfamily)
MPFLRSIHPRGDKPPQPDEALLEAYARTGDLQELADLYERYMELVYGLCIKYLKDPETAKDAVMGIFEVLVRDLHKKYSVQYFGSWLYSVSRNYCLMQIRAAGKEKTVEISPEIMQSGDNPHLNELEEGEEQLRKLEKCIEALPPDQKQTVLLFYRENKCYNEIEVITGYEWNRVRSHIQNARRNLKICMEKKAHAQKEV